jgi:hypothetical protein
MAMRPFIRRLLKLLLFMTFCTCVIYQLSPSASKIQQLTNQKQNKEAQNSQERNNLSQKANARDKTRTLTIADSKLRHAKAINEFYKSPKNIPRSSIPMIVHQTDKKDSSVGTFKNHHFSGLHLLWYIVFN